jgi:hypothetical protein
MAEANKVASKPAPAQPVMLALPVPFRVSKDTDAMLEQTVAERYKSIILVKNAEKDTNKGQPVLSHTPDAKDPNVQVSHWNSDLGNLIRFVQAMVNAWSSGAGLSGDGSALYVAKFAETVFKTVPAIKGYDVYLVPNGRSGASKYRIPVTELVSQVTARAKTIQNCVDAYGIAAGKERTKKAEAAPVIKATL